MDNNLTTSLNDVKPKKPNAVGRFFKFVFVKNIGYKVLAVAVSVALWLIVVGLGG